MKLNLIVAKINALSRHPEWVDGTPLGGGDGSPGGPMFSKATYAYVLAGLTRDIGALLSNKQHGAKLHELGKHMVKGSADGLVAGYEAGDQLCPPWRWPRPKSQWDDLLDLIIGPNPDPWFESLPVALSDLVLAQSVRMLASLTFDKESSAQLKAIGENIVKDIQSKVFDSYCGTPVRPRVPVPKPK